MSAMTSHHVYATSARAAVTTASVCRHRGSRDHERRRNCEHHRQFACHFEILGKGRH